MSYASPVSHFKSLRLHVHFTRNYKTHPSGISWRHAQPQVFQSYQQYIDSFRKLAEQESSSLKMFHITTVCHHTSDLRHPLVMLQTREGSRYLFGKMPEGAQRTLNENGMRLSKLRSVFLCGRILNWSEIGGLPGLFLTASDATSRDLYVYTNLSRILSYVVATWRYFVFRKGIELHIEEPEASQVIADSSTIVYPVKVWPEAVSEEISGSSKAHRQLKKITSLMFPRDTSAVNSENPESYKLDPSETDTHTHTKLPEPGLFDPKGQPSLSYVIRFNPVRGKFDPKKAKELGLKPGSEFRDLTQGKAVFSESTGKWVQPEDVVGPQKTFKKVLIVDIPTQAYLKPSLENKRWFEKSQELGDEEPGLVYHFLGESIDFRLPEYQNFLAKFLPDCQHVISHPNFASDTLVFKTAALHNLKLKTLLNENFSLPHIEKPNKEDFTKLQLLQTFTVTPESISYDDSAVVNENWESLYDQLPEEVQKKRTEVLEKPEFSLEPLPEAEKLKDHVQIFTLGTGLALPLIHRNVLLNLLRIPYVDSEEKVRFQAVLLDGGENTMGALVRNFGHNNKTKLKQILLELLLIYLSHLHADHHLGLVSVINAWLEHNAESTKKLYILAPWQYDHFVNEWMKLEQIFSGPVLEKIVFVSCEDFSQYQEAPYKQLPIDDFEEKFDQERLSERVPRESWAQAQNEQKNQLLSDLGISSIETVRAIHCYWAYSVSMTFQLGQNETFKVSYSGDTRPNGYFAAIGNGSDLLIHEASLDDDLIEEALAKKHSTLTEAVKMAQLMDCPKLVLTHFSTRFLEKQSFIMDKGTFEKRCAKLKRYLGESPENILSQPAERDFSSMEVCYAYDLMGIRYKNLGAQRAVYGEIEKFSELPDELAKVEKEKLKMEQKRDIKRAARLLRKRSRSNAD